MKRTAKLASTLGTALFAANWDIDVGVRNLALRAEPGNDEAARSVYLLRAIDALQGARASLEVAERTAWQLRLAAARSKEAI